MPGWFAAAGLSHPVGSRDSQDPQRYPGSNGVSKQELSFELVYLTLKVTLILLAPMLVG